MPVVWDSSNSQASTWNISPDGLTVSHTGAGNRYIRTNTPFPSGKWYFECTGIGSNGGQAGVSHAGDNYLQYGQFSWLFLPYVVSTYNSAVVAAQDSQPVAIYTRVISANDVIGIAFDADAGKLWVATNGSWLSGNPAAGTGHAVSGITGTLYPTAGLSNDPSADTIVANFGATPMAYTPPSGFSTLDSPPPKTIMLSSGWSIDVVQAQNPLMLTAGWSLETIQPHTLNTEFTYSVEADPVWTPVVTAIAYRLKIVADGHSDLVLPMSSFQTRLRQGTPSYLQVIVPAALDYVDEIEARTAGDIVIERGLRWTDGTIQTDEIARVNFEGLRIDEGSSSSSATLTGHKTATNSAPKTVNLSGTQLRSVSGSSIRYRCEIDNSIKPGDTANINGDSFVVNYIQHVVSVSGAYMEVTNSG